MTDQLRRRVLDWACTRTGSTPPGATLAGVVLRLGDYRLDRRRLSAPCPAPRREHCAARWPHRGKAGQADRSVHVVVDRFDAAAHEVGLVPEAGSAGVPQILLPPQLVRLRVAPALQAVEVAPVLAHPSVRRD